jgi:hypothetical protein
MTIIPRYNRDCVQSFGKLIPVTAKAVSSGVCAPRLSRGFLRAGVELLEMGVAFLEMGIEVLETGVAFLETGVRL